MDAPVDGATLDAAPPKAYAFDVAAIEGHSNAELMKDMPDAEEMFALLGRDLVTKVLVQTPQLSVYHESARPGERVKAHRHGVYQVDYVLRGELRFGSRRVTAGMGFFIPDTLYSWIAGDEGAEWIEIHSGLGGIFTTPRESDA
ncbi:cupin domain-containing protein [Trujillonella endophytica]|uniref:Cupin domain-containing protein n=1 Tax=Trujillonella endophytica TaxID=673521 RepID=A0A1H8SVU9_9ACTN|nr:cupin [Trujillella endophytica]SEO82880.1 hypothetical protein SAMN05660991_01880 [Trujillella endophytica]